MPDNERLCALAQAGDAAARHFHLSENRVKNLHAQAMDDLWLELPWWY